MATSNPRETDEPTPADSQTDGAEARVAPLCSYPLSLARCERKAIRRRRQAALPEAEGEKKGHHVGVAISGGGIRSATFALGIFQALARGNLLKHVDYLSTVSGGGYFGSFLGALYARPEPEEPDCEGSGKRKSQDEAEEKSTRSEEVRKRLTNPKDVAINYLRENGRYLAPAGTSDLLLGGAVLLRNWVTLQVIVMSFLLFVFLAAECILLLAFNGIPNVRATKGLETFTGLSSISEGFVERLLVEQGVWLSPWLVAPLALFVIAGMPLSWSYWTLGRNNLRAIRRPWKQCVEPVWAVLPNALLVGSLWFVLPQSPALAALGSWVAIYAFFMARLSACKRRWVLWTPYLVGPVLWYGLVKSELLTDWTTTEQGLAVFGVSAAAYVAVYAVVMLATKLVSHYKQNATAKRAPHNKQDATTKRAQDAATQAELSADDWQRHRVSVALRTVLMGCALLLAFAVIDTLGRSIYVAAVHDPGVVLGVSGSLLTFFGLPPRSRAGSPFALPARLAANVRAPALD